jgi:hypothetical protein
MNLRPAFGGIVSAAVLAAASSAPAAERAWQDWVLNCQGCHRPDGGGSPGGAPAMPGVLGAFLRTAEGRDYLTRVPGVATAPLPDGELAELLNYVVRRYDGANLPRDFRPYTAAEIAEGRRRILRIDAAATRSRVLSRLPASSRSAAAQTPGS